MVMISRTEGQAALCANQRPLAIVKRVSESGVDQSCRAIIDVLKIPDRCAALSDDGKGSFCLI
jgi:hypothetical protein